MLNGRLLRRTERRMAQRKRDTRLWMPSSEFKKCLPVFRIHSSTEICQEMSGPGSRIGAHVISDDGTLARLNPPQNFDRPMHGYSHLGKFLSSPLLIFSFLQTTKNSFLLLRNSFCSIKGENSHFRPLSCDIYSSTHTFHFHLNPTQTTSNCAGT